jgi:hypothetical protein
MIKQRSKHNLSSTELSTFDPGEFVPIGLTEIIPGDSVQGKTQAVIRALPMLAPLMHEVEVIITHSFVPYRLIWEDWEDFITGGDDGLDTSALPTIDFSGSPVVKSTLANYLGLPVGYDSTASALPFRAYALFYNDHILDEELQTEVTIDKSSGADTTTSTTLKNANWSRDRFTGSNANEQLGAAIQLPLGTEAPVLGIGYETTQTYAQNSTIRESDGTTYAGADLATSHLGTGGYRLLTQENPNHAGYPYIRADLSNASSATVNELREAIALQKFAEMRQIYGSTLEKMTKADFGVDPLDARLQNTEIISRGRGKINFSEVLATAETGTSVDVGDMKGHGIAAMRTNKFRKFFPEFGYLMSFVTVRPKPMYTQAIDRHWVKSTKEDYYSPHLEHMGMQEITNKEVYFDHTTPDGTFGYEPRYNEYRSKMNTAKGEFADSTLNYWHFGRDFSSDPALNSSFITCSPTNRVFSQSVTDNLLAMFRHDFVARRCVKKSVKPVGLI